MIQVAPQMRVLVAVEPADFRNYAEYPVMLRLEAIYTQAVASNGVLLRITRVL